MQRHALISWKTHKKNFTHENTNQLFRKVSKARFKLLKDMKTGDLSVPEDIQLKVKKQDGNGLKKLEKWLQNLLLEESPL
ncbi:hypothetical protein QYM36_009689 [Artemia franciscana]|uniref:Uncharacterized protein n=1 Tax=Artemia franciscana TaxID=6661 RepID=A0AA88HQN9_ARTSF|nr:hypothetical protein QYM36_009689 [Artemia franciscana]